MGDTEAPRIPERQMGSLYPLHSIIGHLDDGSAAAAAESALREAGWEGDDVVAASGEEVTRVSGAAPAGRTLLQRIVAAFPAEETEIENEFKAAAARGAWAIMVRADTDDRRAAAASILKAHGAYGLRYYDNHVIIDL